MKDTYLTNALLPRIPKTSPYFEPFRIHLVVAYHGPLGSGMLGFTGKPLLSQIAFSSFHKSQNSKWKSWKYATCSCSSFPPDLDSLYASESSLVSFMITPITIVLGRIPSVIMTQPVFPGYKQLSNSIGPQRPNPRVPILGPGRHAISKMLDLLTCWRVEQTLWCCHNTLENNFTS